MLRLSPHNHPMWGLYRFHDQKLEGQYHLKGMVGRVIGFRIYCSVSVTLSVLGLLAGIDASPILLWLYLSIAAISLVLILLTVLFNCFVKKHVHIIQPLACFCFALVYSVLVHFDSTAWMEREMAHMAEARSQLPVDDAVVHYRNLIERSLQTEIARVSMFYCILFNFNNWVALTLAGCNLYTLAGYILVFITVVTGLFTMPAFDHYDRFQGISLVIMCTVAMFFSALTLELTRRSDFLTKILLCHEMHASQMADSILNHTLKNTLADVAANTEIFMAGEGGLTLLEDCISCLRRGIKLCKERQVYVKLVGGEYTPVMNAVNLREFGMQLVAGRDVKASFSDATVYMDCMLCNLILENSISNAFKHGCPGSPDVCFDVHLDGSDPVLPTGHQRLIFQVSNAAHPGRPPLTPETVQKLFNGEAELLPNVPVPTLSDRIGLSHCLMAAKLGHITLSLTQNGDRVTFGAVLDVEIASLPQPSSIPSIERRNFADKFPPSLKFVCLDDSAASLRLMEFHIRKLCQPKEIRCLGTAESDIELFLSEALDGADIVILDQHLEYSEMYLGTNLTRKLLALGYKGFICIRSGDDAPEDQQEYARCGANCSFGKDMLGARMIEELKAAYVQHQLTQETIQQSGLVAILHESEMDFDSQVLDIENQTPANSLQTPLPPMHPPGYIAEYDWDLR